MWFEGDHDRRAYSRNRNGFTWPNTRCNGHICCFSRINQWDSENGQDKHKWLRKPKHLNWQLSCSVYVLSRCINSGATITLTCENTWSDKILYQMIWKHVKDTNAIKISLNWQHNSCQPKTLWLDCINKDQLTSLHQDKNETCIYSTHLLLSSIPDTAPHH